MGVFAKVMLAIAILVANGVLLFVILRFLLWLAFPGRSAEDEDAAAARPVFAAGAGAAVAAARARTGHRRRGDSPGSAPSTVTRRRPPGVRADRPQGARAYPHRLLIGLPVILALFAGGVWLGSVVGGSGSAAAATRTVRVTGSVITVNHTTEVRVPAQKVRIKGSSLR